MLNKKHGFTLVEFLIVITVIGIITSLTAMSFVKVQIDAKDSQRANQVKIVSEALEKYYSKNGEYPSCNAMAGSAASVSSLLGIDQSVLKTPTAASGSNSIIAACGDLSVGVDSFAYIGNSSCVASPAIACTKYTLKYRAESINSIALQTSRHGSVTALTSIGAISGATTTIGNTLTAGALVPSDATVSYQWQIATTAGGSYSNISGATGSTYVLTIYDLGKYMKVTATANGSFTGSQTSAASDLITDSNWIAVGGQAWAKTNLNVGNMVPIYTTSTNNATIEKYCYDNQAANCTAYGGLYQWDEAMQYVTTSGAQGLCPAGSHIPTAAEWSNLLSLVSVANLRTGGTSGFNALLGGFGVIASQQFLSLGSVGYYWSSTDAGGGNATDMVLNGYYNTYSTYDQGKVQANNIRCVAGQRTPITAIAAIAGNTSSVGNVLTAGALTPVAATVTYQWQNATTAGGTYTNIAGATGSTYTIKLSDLGKYIKIVATGTGAYDGIVTSSPSAQIPTDPNWIAVGNQVWAKTNLNVGTMINGSSSPSNNAVLEKYCFSNLEDRCTTYGGLYHWAEAMQYVSTEGAQGICPAGSHIPSKNDWDVLIAYLGGSSVAGTAVRSGGSSGLNMSETGQRYTDGSFGLLGQYGYLWSSTDSGQNWNSPWTSNLAANSPTVLGINYMFQDSGLPVRCMAN